MKPHLFICLSCLLLSGASASRAASPAPDYPMQVILDTDLGNDIDDLLALQMLINYEKAGKIALQGISLSKANVHAFELARQYYEAYGTGHPAFGYMSHGPNPDDGHYLTATLAALGTDTLPPAESHEAVDMLRRQLAASAERASIKYKQVEFMADRIGQEFNGSISGVTEFGLYVELDDNKCEGMIPLRELMGDYYEFDERNYCLVGRRTHKRYNLGDKLRIRVERANLDRKQLDFSLVEELDSPTQKATDKKQKDGKKSVSRKSKNFKDIKKYRK